MKSAWLKYLLLAVIGFGIGGAFAFYQNKSKNVTVPSITAEAPQVAPEASTAPTPAMPTVEAPTMASSQPTIEGVPPQPNVAEAAPAPAVAGVPVGGAFALTDHKGNAVTEKSWPGKMKLVFFGFTNCPDVCPAGLQKMSAALEKADATGAKIVPLFITVDPARDTVEAMAKYVANYSPLIVGLTGSEDALKSVQSAYKVYAAKQPPATAPAADASAHAGHEGHDMAAMGNYNVDHSGYVYLMSADDQLLEIFGSSETAETMAAKITARLPANP